MKAALLGTETQIRQLQEQAAELRRRLAKDADGPVIEKRKHSISPEGRARIAAAQRKRWAKSKGKTMAA